jgi:hypothetical protein
MISRPEKTSYGCDKQKCPVMLELLQSSRKSYQPDEHYQSGWPVVFCYHFPHCDAKPLFIAATFSL